MMRAFTKISKVGFVFALLFGSCLTVIGQDQLVLTVNSPASVAGDYSVARATFGDVTTLPVTGDLIATVPNLACEAVTNNLTGKIALIDRGTCAFTIKAKAAQDAGAMAVLICNNTGTGLIAPSGTDATITIPVFGTSLPACNTIKVALAAGNVNVTFRNKPCEIDAPTGAFWGHLPAHNGDFHDGLNGWTVNSIVGLEEGQESWYITTDGLSECPYFGASTPIESPTVCNGAAIMDYCSIGLLVEDPPVQPYHESSAELISPTIDCTGKNHVILQFTTLNNRLNYDNNVAFSIDGGVTWSDPILIETNNSSGGALNTEVINLPIDGMNNQANCKIKFIGDGDFYSWTIDDVFLLDVELKDCAAQQGWFATAQNAKQPYNQADELAFMIDVNNPGNVTATEVSVDVKVEDVNSGAVLHTQTLNYADIPQKTIIENKLFANTYTLPKSVGKYRVSYAVNCKDDQIPGNNTASGEFENNLNLFAKNPTNSDGGIIPSADVRHFSFGNAYHVKKGSYLAGGTSHPIYFDTVRCGINPPATFTGAFVQADVYVIVDLNNDGDLDGTERTKVATGNALLVGDAGETPGDLHIAVRDVANSDLSVQLDDNTNYLVLVSVNPIDVTNAKCSILGEFREGGGSNLAADFALDSILTEEQRFTSFFGTGSDDMDIDTRTLGGSASTAYADTYVTAIPDGVNDIDPTIGIEVNPNPASNLVNVAFSLEKNYAKVGVQVMDLTGRAMISKLYNNVQNQKAEIDVTNLANGAYILKISTADGFKTQKFVVQH